MKEIVGTCSQCGKELFCLDGFFNGVHSDNKTFCYDCAEASEKSAD